jgi:hypothetical protein
VHTVLPAFTFTRRRVRVHARVRAGTTPSCQRAPQHARTPTWKARLDLWSLFLRWASRMRSCRPRLHGLAVAGCFAHAVVGEGAPSSWSPSARLATGRSFLARVCADCGRLARRHPWRWPEIRRGSHRAAPFSANIEPKPCCSPYARAPKRTPSHACSRTSSPERAPTPPAEYRRRADVAVPTPTSTLPRRPPPSSLRSFEPIDPRGSLEVIP